MSKLPRSSIVRIVGSNNHRDIKAFEEVFNALPTQTELNDVESGTIDAKVNQTIGTAIESLRIVKGANVLLWLSM
jgi:hypothetical protein